ncbi:MAG: preprotein translocase subunit SecY [Oscillospiraceae bacterium]|nr:preprotein translocase subunit SecY [Oscillospiraceae bacterium]
MIKTVREAWKIPELKKKIIFTLLILLIYRIGNAIPVPYVDVDLLGQYFTQLSNTVLGLYNMMSGGALSMATVFALSIQPYINSSIIIQLLTIAIPALERLARDGGEEGRKKIASITRYTTVAIALIQGFGYYMLMRNNSLLTDPGLWAAIVIIATFTAGSAFLMWLGEQITEFGIGNGISIILFASIISRLPKGVSNLSAGVRYWNRGLTKADNPNLFVLPPWGVALIIIGILALTVFIVFIYNAERRIPVQYAKRVVGRKMYGGQSSHLPMKVNMSGVLPIIFAQSIASLPATIGAFCRTTEGGPGAVFLRIIDTDSVLYCIIYFLLIVAFSFFYATIQFNPIEVSNNLKRNGGFIPGYRPGKPTADFIRKALNKITLFGAIYLAIVAIVPIIISVFTDRSVSLGGTSVIIVVGVALETVKALESQMLMRHYKGFLE